MKDILILGLACLLIKQTPGELISKFNKIDLRYQGNANIGNKTYYIDTNGVAWNESLSLCQSREQSLVSFDDEGEYISVESWLKTNGFSAQWFWTSGWRDLQTWQWRSTGENVSDSTEYWIEGQPSVPVDESPACMSFATDLGWDDDQQSFCLQMYLFSTICE